MSSMQDLQKKELRDKNIASVVKVGIGVMIFKDGKVLLGKRKGSHGAGEYSFTGGHMEFGESFEECAKRETREEAGVEIQNVNFLLLSNIKNYPGKHYVLVGLIADWKAGEAKVTEPDKIDEWRWYGLDELPTPLFEPTKQMVEAYTEKFNYLDS